MTELLQKLSELKKLAEVAGTVEDQFMDFDTMTPEEIASYATISRLQRLADAKKDSILNDHLLNVNSIQTADRMVSQCTLDYLLDLPVSYSAVSEIAEALIAQVQKYTVEPSLGMIAARDGSFEVGYAAELGLGD